MTEDVKPVAPPKPEKVETRGDVLRRERRNKLKRSAGRTVGSRSITPSQKAEAVALWRAGEVTLSDLATKFNKRPETFSRIFKEMGIKKGENAAATVAKVTAAVETKILSDSEQLALRIAQARDEHYRMSSGIAKLVWATIVKARQENKSLEDLKGTMQTLQLAQATIGKAREEIYRILQVDKHEGQSKDDDLPELVVQELSQAQIMEMQGARAEVEGELDVAGELGLDDDEDDEPSHQEAPGAAAAG